MAMGHTPIGPGHDNKPGLDHSCKLRLVQFVCLNEAAVVFDLCLQVFVWGGSANRGLCLNATTIRSNQTPSQVFWAM